MHWQLKSILMFMMCTALACGFMHHLISPALYNFERLHIFLFNLCSGGTLLIYYTEGKEQLSRQGKLFLVLAIAFALSAFLQYYIPALIIPLVLAFLIEKVRIACFGSLWPKAFFSLNLLKFNQISQIFCIFLLNKILKLVRIY